MTPTWHFAGLLLTACLCAGCSPSDEPVPDRRPGEEHPSPTLPATLRFVPATVEIATADSPYRTQLALSLVREGSELPDTTYVLSANDPRNIISHLPEATFSHGQTTLHLSIGITASPEAGQTLRASIMAQPAPGIAHAKASVAITGIDIWTDAGTAMFVSGDMAQRVHIYRQTIAGRCHIRATDSQNDILRQFVVEPDGIINIADAHGLPAGYTCATSAGNADKSMRLRFPVLSLPSRADQEQGWYGLNRIYTGADGTCVPHYEIIVADNTPGWSETFACTIVDGWLAPVVSFEARPPMIPSENPWAVAMQQNTSDPSQFRLIGMYRGGSPLSPLNSSPTPGIVSLATGNGQVEIPPQSAGFANSALFATPFVIGGSGTLTTDGSTVTATVPVPLHNAYGAYGTSWAQPVPAVLSWKMK